MDDGWESQEDFLKQFGQTPRWGPTPNERSGQAGQLQKDGCRPWDAQAEVKELTSQVLDLSKRISEVERVMKLLMEHAIRGY